MVPPPGACCEAGPLLSKSGDHVRVVKPGRVVQRGEATVRHDIDERTEKEGTGVSRK